MFYWTGQILMLRLLTNSPARLLSALSILTIVVAIAPTVNAAAPRSAPTIRPSLNRPSNRPLVASKDRPICFGQLGGKTLNLDRLCGVGLNKSNTIDLSVDADGDGVSDQLLVEMRKFRKVIADAKSSDEYQSAYQRLEDRMPYSNNVKQLQAQQRQLQKQLESGNGNMNEQSYRQLSALQEKIYRDPSYTKVQQAMSKVYRKLDR
jgi:hypothetical protein